MTKKIHAIIHGKTIEFDEDLGMAEGRLTIVQSLLKRGEGILRSAEGWVDYPELDAIMNQIQQDRTLQRRVQIGNE